MPKSNSDNITSKEFFERSTPENNISNVFTGDQISVDLEKANIPELVKNHGYSVLLNKDKSPQAAYLYVVSSAGSPTFVGDSGTASGDREPYVYITLRKVLDTKNLKLAIGAKWTDTANLISAIDDNDKPIAEFAGVDIKVDDKDNIVKDGKVTKAGELSVTYSYKISDKYYDNKIPYIVSKTAYVTVAPDKVPTPKPVMPTKPTTTKPSANHDSGTQVNTSTPNTIENINHLLATFPDKGDVTLYRQDGSLVKNRALGNGTDWFSDKVMTTNQGKMYRVSTSEWVKAADVYLYESQDLVIETKNDDQMLTSSEGNPIKNRALAPNTTWRTDQLATINGKMYYRVATNEFVPVDSVVINR